MQPKLLVLNPTSLCPQKGQTMIHRKTTLFLSLFVTLLLISTEQGYSSDILKGPAAHYYPSCIEHHPTMEIFYIFSILPQLPLFLHDGFRDGAIAFL